LSALCGIVALMIEDLTLAPVDSGFVQRAKALACTAPLHDLDARKSQLQGSDFTRYQMSELALHAIDLVTLAMDFDRGANHQRVVADLVPLVAMQAPDQPATEHEQVARWVLNNLINVGSADRGFRAVYGMPSAQGTYQRHWFDFKLLAELVSEAGEIYLRATDEAVNVLIGALDTDIESAQIAADLKLDTLIRRGKLSHAQAAAEQARYRTIQYGETLRRRLESTRRDVRTVDWLREMPALITTALDHIESRYQAENAILVNLTTTRDTAETLERKRQAARLIDIVRECLRRHEQLQTRLQEAGRAFRAEQDRQTFAPQPSRAEIDLHGQVLVPVLRLSLREAAAVASAFFDAVAGPAVPPTPRLWDLTERLLAPPSEHDHLGAELVEPELVERPDPARFSHAQWKAAAELLGGVGDLPRRLSELLALARVRDPELPLLVALLAYHDLCPPLGTAIRQGDPCVRVSVDDGTSLDDPEFGGADLLLAQARVRESAAEAIDEKDEVA
jgi:hypothetical protein